MQCGPVTCTESFFMEAQCFVIRFLWICFLFWDFCHCLIQKRREAHPICLNYDHSVESKKRHQIAQESNIIINIGRALFLQNGHFSSVFTAIVTNTSLCKCQWTNIRSLIQVNVKSFHGTCQSQILVNKTCLTGEIKTSGNPNMEQISTQSTEPLKSTQRVTKGRKIYSVGKMQVQFYQINGFLDP